MTKTIDPSACTPENVARLLLQLEETEVECRKALAHHNQAVAEVKDAARCSPDHPWADVIARIKTAVDEHMAPDSMAASRYAELRKCYEAANRSSELNSRRTQAFRTVVYQLQDLARSRNPDLICYSGANMLAIIKTLDTNPDA